MLKQIDIFSLCIKMVLHQTLGQNYHTFTYYQLDSNISRKENHNDILGILCAHQLRTIWYMYGSFVPTSDARPFWCRERKCVICLARLGCFLRFSSRYMCLKCFQGATRGWGVLHVLFLIYREPGIPYVLLLVPFSVLLHSFIFPMRLFFFFCNNLLQSFIFPMLIFLLFNL